MRDHRGKRKMVNDVLKKIYYNPASVGSYSSVSNLFREARKIDPNVKLDDVKDFLNSQITYSLHKRVVRKFHRNKIVVSNINEYCYMDLIDFIQYKNENNGYSYILCAIDGFTRFAMCTALKNKQATSIRDAIAVMFPIEQPSNIMTDNGGEFHGVVRDWCRQNEVNLITVKDEVIKCSMVERLIRTLKAKIGKIFTSRGNHKWIDVLSDITSAYNRSYHSSIKMKPIDVTYQHRKQLLKTLYGVENVLDLLPTVEHPKLKQNQPVRLVKPRSVFEKSYLPRHTEEIFHITGTATKHNRPMYTVEDKKKDPITGKFYKNELNIVREEADPYFRIEYIVDTRTRKGVKEIKVHWLHYPSAFDSWISASEVRNVANINHG